MKVLIFCNNDSGLYKFRKELLQRLLDMKAEVIIVLPGGSYIDLLKNMGCRYIDLPFNRRGMNPFADVMLFWQFLRIIRENHPDIVLTYTVKPNVYGGMACRIKGIPYIANITGLGTALENPGMLNRLVLALYRVGLKKASCVFFQNEANRDFAIRNRLLQGEYVLLPGSGINLKDFQPLPYPEGKQVHFLFIGRIMHDKGIDELLEAAENLKREKYDFTLDLIGGMDGQYEEKLKNAQAQGLIAYHGFQEQVIPFIASAHCIILPSYHEGMANVLLEAAASARPIIATRIPGCRETYTEGVSGLGCDAADSVSLAAAMRKFIEMSPDARKNMGLAGSRKVAGEFDREIVISAYIRKIEAVIGRKN